MMIGFCDGEHWITNLSIPTPNAVCSAIIRWPAPNVHHVKRYRLRHAMLICFGKAWCNVMHWLSSVTSILRLAPNPIAGDAIGWLN